MTTEINAYSINLQKDEYIIFSYSAQKGIITKRLSRLYSISNFRAFEWNAETSKMEGMILLQDLQDCLIMNSFRVFDSTRVSGYSSLFRGVGVSTGYSHGKSFQVGDVVFMSHGKPMLVWPRTTNPSDLRRLILAIKKELYPTKELQRFLTGVKNDNLSIIRNVSTCLRCGTKNVKDASFCSACGSILK